MKILRGKREAKEEPQQPERLRKEFDETYRVGRTFAGDARKTLEEKKARIADRKRRNFKNIVTVVLSVVLVIVIVVVIWNYIANVIAEREAAITPPAPLEPKSTIIDENAGENVSRRVKDFVAYLEEDVSDYGLKIDHVVLPLQKAREVDIFIEGRGEFYKMSLDRGSAVQAEDMHRMIQYLDQRELHPSYVDLRVEGKAYYK